MVFKIYSFNFCMNSLCILKLLKRNKKTKHHKTKLNDITCVWNQK